MTYSGFKIWGRFFYWIDIEFMVICIPTKEESQQTRSIKEIPPSSE